MCNVDANPTKHEWVSKTETLAIRIISLRAPHVVRGTKSAIAQFLTAQEEFMAMARPLLMDNNIQSGEINMLIGHAHPGVTDILPVH